MLFYVYVFFLIASGVMMLALGSFRAPYARRRRVVNSVVGAAFLLYGLYLLTFFGGGHYFLFYYAFVVPVLLAVQFFRDRTAYRAASGEANSAPQAASRF
jgi:fatty acid desaturase